MKATFNQIVENLVKYSPTKQRAHSITARTSNTPAFVDGAALCRRCLARHTSRPSERPRPSKPKPGKAQADDSTDTTDEAPVEGLELVETAEGVAVIGDSRTTYRNRKQIKAHGARWNKEAQQWQASEPEAVARLREWFVVSDTPTAEEADTTNESEPQKNAPTAQSEHTPTTTSDNTEPTEADDTEPTETDSTTAQPGANATLYEAGEITATAPTDTAEDFAAVLASDRLKLLRSAADDFDRLTQAGEHIAAVNARLSALFACGVDVADLVQDADYKADQRARQRAAVVLTADEFRTLYGFSKEEQPADCGRVWKFERGTDANGHELHEIRRVPSGFMVFFNVCEATGGGCSTMVVYPTYCEALEVLTRCRPGAQLIAEPAA